MGVTRGFQLLFQELVITWDSRQELLCWFLAQSRLVAAWFGADLSNHRVAGPAHEWKFSCRDASMMQVPTIPQSFVFLCLSILGLSLNCHQCSPVRNKSGHTILFFKSFPWCSIQYRNFLPVRNEPMTGTNWVNGSVLEWYLWSILYVFCGFSSVPPNNGKKQPIPFLSRSKIHKKFYILIPPFSNTFYCVHPLFTQTQFH